MKKKKKKSSLPLIIILLAGIALLLYPTVSDWWNGLHQTVAISEYTKLTAELDEETYNKFLDEAHEYNDKLFKQGGNRFIVSPEDLSRYNSTLNLSAKGIMGFIEIPSIQVKLPIYHGTGETVLSSGIGHLEGTALPVGGKNTHCVLSGHRGLPSAKLFSDLDKIKEGDYFMITVLDELITYEVDQIRIVLPQEINELFTVPGEDYCTLVTCTPYGVNTHRILVRGHRTANITDRVPSRVTSDAIQIEPIIIAPIAAIPMIVSLLVILGISNARKKRRRKILISLAEKTEKP